MFELTKTVTSVDGRLTRQLLSCMKQTSAVEGGLLGAMLASEPLGCLSGMALLTNNPRITVIALLRGLFARDNL